jgi:hypothetical protein
MRRLALFAAAAVMAAALAAAQSPAQAVSVHQHGKRVTWYHICMAVNHSLCEIANGTGNNLTVENTGANKWQAIADPDSGDIEWQNGSGHCMVATSNGNVTVIGAGCNDASDNQDWEVGGSGNLTFFNQAAVTYMGTFGPQAGKYVYVRSMSGNFYAGWVTIGV